MTTYDFEVMAKNAVIKEIKEKYSEDYKITDISLVWFCKTLQNMKAILIDNGENNRMYEVTLNGSKNQAYVDCYEKKSNTCIESENFDLVAHV